MRKRVDHKGLVVTAPTEGGMEDMEAQSLEEKLQVLRAHRDWKCNVKWEVLNEHKDTWKTNGLADLSYDLLEQEEVGEGGTATRYRVDVKLNGHWTDTVHEMEASNNGGGGRGGGRGGWRGGRGGGDQRDRDRDRDRRGGDSHHHHHRWREDDRDHQHKKRRV